jgi:hypothetical protein
MTFDCVPMIFRITARQSMTEGEMSSGESIKKTGGRGTLRGMRFHQILKPLLKRSGACGSTLGP